MISAHRIVYNKLSSEDIDVIPYLSFNEDDGTVSTFLDREGVYSEHYDGHRTIHRAKSNNVFTPRFTLMKSDYGEFDDAENRKVLSWLTSSDKPGWFQIYKDDSNVLSWQIFGYVTTVEQYKIGNGRVVAYEFEVESSHPHAWSHKFIYPERYETIQEIANNNENNDYMDVDGQAEFTITCDTDDYSKPVYPQKTLEFKDGDRRYLSLNFNPLENNTYTMLPNVIYSWVERYIKATEYNANTKYYLDKNGTEANPQPTEDEVLNGEYYVEVNKEHLYVNLNGTKDSGKYEVQLINSNDLALPEGLRDYKYYYFTDGTIKKIVKNEENNDEWAFVSQTSKAVRIKNTYISNGAPIEKETIITGGVPGETIVLNGTNKVISGRSELTTNPIGDNFNWQWLPLIYGDNKIEVIGNCTMKFEWFEPRKVGSL